MTGNPMSLFFIPVGILVLIVGVYWLRRAIPSKNWPTTEEKVLSSEIPRGWRPIGEVGMAKVVYEYSVYGKVYSSKRVCFLDYNANLGERSRAERILRWVPQGKDCDCPL